MPDPASDSIYLIQPDGTLTHVSKAPYAHESDLQQLLADYPELIPGAQINREAPCRWLVVRNEAGVPSEEGGGDWWAVDHLLLDQDGVPTLVEVKRATDTRIRREVVAQMLEYAANGTAYWRADGLRKWFESPERAAGRDAGNLLEERLGIPASETEGFWVRVEENLRAGNVRCVFVADQIPATLRRIVEFLNDRLEGTEVIAVEVPQFIAPGAQFRAIAPRVVGQTERARAVKAGQSRAARQWDVQRFFAAVDLLGDANCGRVARGLYEWAKNHADGVGFGNGKVEGSLRILAWGGEGYQVPFTLWTTGHPEIGFEYLKSHEPFSELGLRSEMRERLNGVPSVSLPGDAVERRPSIQLKMLADESVLKEMLTVMEWTLDRIRSTARQ